MSVQDAFGLIEQIDDCTVSAQERMSRHTSLRVGGACSLFICCDTYSSLRQVDRVLAQCGVPWVILGRGASVVVSDEGYAGAVIVLGRDFRKFSLDDHCRMHAGAGASMMRIVQAAFGRGLAGLEFAVGLPGTVGGAISTNISTGVACIGDLVEEVVVYRPDDGFVRYAGSDIEWFHRFTTIPPREIILEVTLQLRQGDEAQVKRQTEEVLSWRNACQPTHLAAADAIFLDPPEFPDTTASKLIADCGLTGHERGRAQLFERDPNFIVNLGGATSTDITNVMITTLSKVRQRHGIGLKPQVKFLGFPS